jgi:hypothetical protein
MRLISRSCAAWVVGLGGLVTGCDAKTVSSPVSSNASRVSSVVAAPSIVAPREPDPGVVPAQLLAQLHKVMTPLPMLGGVAACAKGRPDGGCERDKPVFGETVGEPLTLAVRARDRRAAVLSARDRRPGADCAIRGDVLDLVQRTVVASTLLQTHGCATPLEELGDAIASFGASLEADGYVPATRLVALRAFQKDGNRVATPLVALGPPLEGWMVWGARMPGTASWTVALVEPDNARKIDLETLVPRICTGADGGAPCTDPGPLSGFTFHDVALMPDRATVVVTFDVGGAIRHGIYELPSGVLPPSSTTPAILEVLCSEASMVYVSEGDAGSAVCPGRSCGFRPDHGPTTFLLPPGTYRISVGDADAFRPGGNICAAGVVDLVAKQRLTWTASYVMCGTSKPYPTAISTRGVSGPPSASSKP